MKIRISLASVCLLIISVFCTHKNAKAQLFKNLKDKVNAKIQQKANSAIDQTIDGKTMNPTLNQSTHGENPVRMPADKNFDFKAGTRLLFQDNFTNDQDGLMATHWKTSGSGSVGEVPSIDGKYLLLNEFTSYKFKSDKALKGDFSIEFDIATHSNNSAKDLENISFGFTHDNSISSFISDAYNENAITNTQIHYWNGAIINSSSDTKIYNTIDFPLASYAVAKMHVILEVKGENMRVYLDKVKVLDTRMFNSDEEPKYFYISSATKIDNSAKIGVGNFLVAAY